MNALYVDKDNRCCQFIHTRSSN